MDKFIDTHAHYNSNKFKNRDRLLLDLRKEVEYIINLGTDVNSNLQTMKLIYKHDYLYGMVGFFPTNVYQIEKELSDEADINLICFHQQIDSQKIVGIGEIGLDYHWNCVGDLKGEKAREYQKKWFLYQLNLAKELNLPVSMHSRDAEKDTIEIFNNYESIKGVMHCFSYGLDSAKIYLEKGLYFGIGGTSTYPSNKELREVIDFLPIDKILLETDAPYLSPNQVRRAINTSSNIKYVIENIAKIKGISEEDVIKETNKNAINLFKFGGNQ